MATWEQICEEVRIESNQSPQDRVRRKYLAALNKKTKRNVIAYYSGWLQKPGLPPEMSSITDDDKNSFMAAVHGMDRTKGLDLVLHTPGGDIAATESIVDYLQKMFNNDIRVIVPQLAMSAGTMIACTAKEIVMGKHSNLGPIDPQFNGIPAYGVIEEFEKAKEEIKKDPSSIPVWQVVVSKYHPAFIGECEKAIEWSKSLAQTWLKSIMFDGDEAANSKIKTIIFELSNHANTKNHARHIPKEKCKDMGLKIVDLESDQNMQDLVLSVHHSFMNTFQTTAAVKIIENHQGKAVVQQALVAPQAN